MSYSKEKNPIFHLIFSAISLLIHFNCLLDNPALDNALLLTSLLSSSGNSADNNSSNTDETETNLIPIDLSLWTKRAKITIDNSAQSEDLINFPVLVTLTNATFTYANAKADGSDIRFSDSTGAFRLDYELDFWSYNNTSYFWVKVPLIPANSNTSFIWIYYGNPTATFLDLSQSTWDSNYKAVYHLTNLNDSTSNGHTILACSGFNDTGVPETAGRTVNTALIGSSQYFDGSKTCLRAPANILSSGSTQGTIELSTIFLFPPPPSGNTTHILSHSSNPEATTNNRLKLSIYNTTSTSCNTTDRRIYLGLGNDFTGSCAGDSSYNAPFDFSVVHFALTWYNGNYTIYVNNALNSSIYSQTGLLSNGMHEEIGIGARFNEIPKGYYLGLIDEVRLSNTVRSTNWLKAQYLSKTNAFLMLGAEESI